jgi:hypothetical protein
MEYIEHKKEIKENMKQFIKIITQEHGCSVEKAKIILISEVMDSAYEMINGE